MGITNSDKWRLSPFSSECLRGGEPKCTIWKCMKFSIHQNVFARGVCVLVYVRGCVFVCVFLILWWEIYAGSCPCSLISASWPVWRSILKHHVPTWKQCRSKFSGCLFWSVCHISERSKRGQEIIGKKIGPYLTPFFKALNWYQAAFRRVLWGLICCLWFVHCQSLLSGKA